MPLTITFFKYSQHTLNDNLKENPYQKYQLQENTICTKNNLNFQNLIVNTFHCNWYSHQINASVLTRQGYKIRGVSL